MKDVLRNNLKGRIGSEKEGESELRKFKVVCFLKTTHIMSQTFEYQEGGHSYQVPDGVTCLQIQCWGAQGGARPSAGAFSFGGYTEGIFPVTPGTFLTVFPGETGTILSTSTPDGGGIVDGGLGPNYDDFIADSFGGGAGSFVAEIGAAASTDCIIVAGGGGGYGFQNLTNRFGGNGGGPIGGENISPEDGKGGNGTTPGAGGVGATASGASGSAGNGGSGATLGNTRAGGGGGGLAGGGGGGITDGGSTLLGSGGGGSGGFPNLAYIPFPGSINSTQGDVDYLANPNPSGPEGGYIIITPLVCPCLAEGSLVCLADGRQISIEQLVPCRDQLLNWQGQNIEIGKIVRFKAPSKQFVRIASGKTLSSNRDLLIREGHTILYEEQEVPVEALLGKPGIEKIILEQPKFVYTLVTNNKEFVSVQNVMVSTWSARAWNQEVIARKLQFDYIN